MILKLILSLNLFLLSSCFDFSSSKFKTIDNEFKYGYFNDNLDLLNVYYNDGGIFSQMKCINIEWNQLYIFVNCEDLKDHQNRYFIIDKLKYKSNPIQLKSIGVLGPLNYDSITQSVFFKTNHLDLKKCDASLLH